MYYAAYELSNHAHELDAQRAERQLEIRRHVAALRGEQVFHDTPIRTWIARALEPRRARAAARATARARAEAGSRHPANERTDTTHGRLAH